MSFLLIDLFIHFGSIFFFIIIIIFLLFVLLIVLLQHHVMFGQQPVFYTYAPVNQPSEEKL